MGKNDFKQCFRAFFAFALLWLLSAVSTVFAANTATTGVTNTVPVPLDSRFVQAIKHLNILYSDQAPITINQQQNEVVLQQQGNVIFTLKPHDFATLYQGVKQAALTLMQQQPVASLRHSTATFDDLTFTPQALIETLKNNNITAKTDNGALRQSVRALLLLNFFAHDELDAMSIVQADSLMMLAWLEARSGSRDNALLTLLADNLGYQQFAKRQAAALENHSLRYLYQQTAPDNRHIFADLLRVRQAATGHRANDWQQAVARLGTQPVSLSFSLYGIREVPSYNVRSKLLLLYPLIIYRDYLGDATIKPLLFKDDDVGNGLNLSIDNIAKVSDALSRGLDFSPAFLLDTFDKDIKTAETLSNDGVLSAEVLVNYWQSRLLNAYYDIALYLSRVEYNQRLSDSLLKVFKANRDVPTARLLSAWFDAVLTTDNYQTVVDDFQQIADANPTSVVLLYDLYTWQKTLKPIDTKAHQAAGKQLWEQLDSREQHRDKHLALQLATAPDSVDSIADVPVTPITVRALIQAGNVDLLQQALAQTEDVSDSSAQHARLLQALAQAEATRADERKRYQNALQRLYNSQSPTDFTVLETYVEQLLQQGQSTAAMKVLDKRISEQHDLSRAQFLAVMTLVARSKQAAGDLDAAWQTIAPTLVYDYPQAMQTAAEIALASGDQDSIRTTVTDYRQHFPDTPQALSLQLRDLWSQKRFDESAKLLSASADNLDHALFYRLTAAGLATANLTTADKQRLLTAVEQLDLPKAKRQTLSRLLP